MEYPVIALHPKSTGVVQRIVRDDAENVVVSVDCFTAVTIIGVYIEDDAKADPEIGEDPSLWE